MPVKLEAWGDGKMRNMANGEWRMAERLHPPSNIHHPSGISLLEVLVSLFILSVGLLSVAALIPIGKLALVNTNKSDRTGACGRAGLSEIRIRRMLDYTTWITNTGPVPPGATPGTIAIDPLGYANGLNGMNLGGAGGPIPRITLAWATGANVAMAEAVFRWPDELQFHSSDDSTDRPRALVYDSTGNFVIYDPPTHGTNVTFARDGNFSWFITATPSPADVANGVTVANRRSYNVSVVVCHKREFTTAAERTAGANILGGGYGGGTITLINNDADTSPLVVRENEWILLYSATQCAWYRAVSSVTINNGDTEWLSLVGPDWHGGAATAVVIPGVTGVYTTTVQVD